MEKRGLGCLMLLSVIVIVLVSSSIVLGDEAELDIDEVDWIPADITHFDFQLMSYDNCNLHYGAIMHSQLSDLTSSFIASCDCSNNRQISMDFKVIVTFDDPLNLTQIRIAGSCQGINSGVNEVDNNIRLFSGNNEVAFLGLGPCSSGSSSPGSVPWNGIDRIEILGGINDNARKIEYELKELHVIGIASDGSLSSIVESATDTVINTMGLSEDPSDPSIIVHPLNTLVIIPDDIRITNLGNKGVHEGHYYIAGSSSDDCNDAKTGEAENTHCSYTTGDTIKCNITLDESFSYYDQDMVFYGCAKIGNAWYKSPGEYFRVESLFGVDAVDIDEIDWILDGATIFSREGDGDQTPGMFDSYKNNIRDGRMSTYYGSISGQYTITATFEDAVDITRVEYQGSATGYCASDRKVQFKYEGDNSWHDINLLTCKHGVLRASEVNPNGVAWQNVKEARIKCPKGLTYGFRVIGPDPESDSADSSYGKDWIMDQGTFFAKEINQSDCTTTGFFTTGWWRSFEYLYDENEYSGIGAYCIKVGGGSLLYNLLAEFPQPVDIRKIEYRGTSSYWGICDDTESRIELYYDGAWHEEDDISFSTCGTVAVESRSAIGDWSNVEKLRVWVSYSSDVNARVDHFIRELHVFGSASLGSQDDNPEDGNGELVTKNWLEDVRTDFVSTMGSFSCDYQGGGWLQDGNLQLHKGSLYDNDINTGFGAFCQKLYGSGILDYTLIINFPELLNVTQVDYRATANIEDDCNSYESDILLHYGNSWYPIDIPVCGSPYTDLHSRVGEWLNVDKMQMHIRLEPKGRKIEHMVKEIKVIGTAMDRGIGVWDDVDEGLQEKNWINSEDSEMISSIEDRSCTFSGWLPTNDYGYIYDDYTNTGYGAYCQMNGGGFLEYLVEFDFKGKKVDVSRVEYQAWVINEGMCYEPDSKIELYYQGEWHALNMPVCGSIIISSESEMGLWGKVEKARVFVKIQSNTNHQLQHAIRELSIFGVESKGILGDTNGDNYVEMNELVNLIQEWKDGGNVNLVELVEAIEVWKRGRQE